MRDVGHYIALSDNFAESALQGWNLLVLLNLAAIGWAVSSRREGNTGVGSFAALVIALALFSASLLAITASTYFNDRAGLALAYVQAVESSVPRTHEELEALRSAALAPIGYDIDYFVSRLRRMSLFIAVSGATAMITGGLLSRIRRS